MNQMALNQHFFSMIFFQYVLWAAVAITSLSCLPPYDSFFPSWQH